MTQFSSSKRTVFCSVLGVALIVFGGAGTAQADEPAPAPAPPIVCTLPGEILGVVLPGVETPLEPLCKDFHDWG